MDMMIGLAAAAFVLCTGVPTYSYMAQKHDIKSVSSQLYLSLNDARNEALRRRSPIRVCPSAHGGSCRDDGDWSDGWLIFEDVNENNKPGSAEIIEFIYNFDAKAP